MSRGWRLDAVACCAARPLAVATTRCRGRRRALRTPRSPRPMWRWSAAPSATSDSSGFAASVPVSWTQYGRILRSLTWASTDDHLRPIWRRRKPPRYSLQARSLARRNRSVKAVRPPRKPDCLACQGPTVCRGQIEMLAEQRPPAVSRTDRNDMTRRRRHTRWPRSRTANSVFAGIHQRDAPGRSRTSPRRAPGGGIWLSFAGEVEALAA